MDYSIINERLMSLSNGTAHVVAELVAASSEDIPQYNAINGRILRSGSTAIVPSEQKVYILDVDLLWTDWSNGDKINLPDESQEESDA